MDIFLRTLILMSKDVFCVQKFGLVALLHCYDFSYLFPNATCTSPATYADIKSFTATPGCENSRVQIHIPHGKQLSSRPRGAGTARRCQDNPFVLALLQPTFLWESSAGLRCISVLNGLDNTFEPPRLTALTAHIGSGNQLSRNMFFLLTKADPHEYVRL